MRGKQDKENQAVINERITPADAGKTNAIAFLEDFSEDHPRGCGENSKKVFCRWVKQGSPPRMRGKQNAK